jgi:hypothetical protein
VKADIYRGQEDSPDTTEDEESHSCFLGTRPPLVLLLKIDEGIDRKHQLRNSKGKHYTEEDAYACQ